MAIRRTSSNSISNAVKLSTGFASAAIPNPPTIGTATATSDVAATVEYTAAVLGATASTFTATSNPGSVTGTGSSPITVTGLTASTAYTFTVTAGNANGTSAASSASNSITTSEPISVLAYESIANSVVTSSNTQSITFTSIPQTYKHLQIRGIGKWSKTSAADVSNLIIRFNSDSSSNYARHSVGGVGTSSISGGANINASEGYIGYSPDSVSAFTNIFSGQIIDILDYSNTNKNKTIRTFGGFDSNSASFGYIHFMGTLWRSTNAINSITLYMDNLDFSIQSQYALYGIKG